MHKHFSTLLKSVKKIRIILTEAYIQTLIGIHLQYRNLTCADIIFFKTDGSKIEISSFDNLDKNLTRIERKYYSKK